MEIVGLVADIGQTALSVGGIVAKAAPTHRQCDIVITNHCVNYTLCNPKRHTTRGRCSNPFPPKIAPTDSGEALFTKNPFTATGCLGVVTFDLLDNSTQAITERIAVMFKVPFDLNLKSNMYAVGVFDISKECNPDLLRDMSKNTDESWFVRGKAKVPSLTHVSKIVTIMATMSDCYTPVMKVQVSDS